MPREKTNSKGYLQSITIGFLLTIVIIAALFIYNKNLLPNEFFLYETIPFYNYGSDNSVSKLFKIFDSGFDSKSDNELEVDDAKTNKTKTDITPENQPDPAIPENKTPVVISQPAFNNTPSTSKKNTDITKTTVFNENPLLNVSNKINKIEDTKTDAVDVIGTHSIMYQPETSYVNNNDALNTEVLVPYEIDDLKNIEFLRSHFYTVEENTHLTAEDFDITKFLSSKFEISTSGDKPKVLIFHTHSTEGYKDSNPSDIYDGIVGVGEYLKYALENKYGIKTMHLTERFDFVDGAPMIMGAYERMNPEVAKILQENPSIEIVIDLHRDALPEGYPKIVTEINGKPTAKIMFFNGLSKLYENGKIKELTNLPNPNLKENLAFSFNMQLAANEIYPGFTRKIYLRAYRYSLHFKPKSLLVEIGADSNTKEEAFNAAEPLAEILAKVVLKN